MTSSVVTHDTARRADAPGAASGADVMSCAPGTEPADRGSLGAVSDEELSRLRVIPARHPGRIVLAVLVGEDGRPKGFPGALRQAMMPYMESEDA